MSDFWVMGIFLSIYGTIDILKKQIPVWPMFPVGIFGIFSMFDRTVEDNMTYIAGVFIGICMLALGRITKEEIGYGDGLVFMITGLYLGYQYNLLLLVLSLIISAMISLILILFKKVHRKTSIPFVPFVTVAYFILWGVYYI